MKIKLLTNCDGKCKCDVFCSPEDLIQRLGEKPSFQNLMQAMQLIKSWKKHHRCPFEIQNPPRRENDEPFHKAICAIKSTPPFSMEAISRGTGYSKTRVAQIEYSAIRKFRKGLRRSSGDLLHADYGIDVKDLANISKSRL